MPASVGALRVARGLVFVVSAFGALLMGPIRSCRARREPRPTAGASGAKSGNAPRLRARVRANESPARRLHETAEETATARATPHGRSATLAAPLALGPGLDELREVVDCVHALELGDRELDVGPLLEA